MQRKLRMYLHSPLRGIEIVVRLSNVCGRLPQRKVEPPHKPCRVRVPEICNPSNSRVWGSTVGIRLPVSGCQYPVTRLGNFPPQTRDVTAQSNRRARLYVWRGCDQESFFDRSANTEPLISRPVGRSSCPQPPSLNTFPASKNIPVPDIQLTCATSDISRPTAKPEPVATTGYLFRTAPRTQTVHKNTINFH